MATGVATGTPYNPPVTSFVPDNFPWTPVPAGASLGGKLSFPTALSAPGTVVLDSIVLFDKSAQDKPFTLLLFDDDPGTINNRDVVNPSQLPHLAASLSLTTSNYLKFPDETFGALKNLNLSLTTTSGTTVYALLIPTEESRYPRSALSIDLRFLQ